MTYQIYYNGNVAYDTRLSNYEESYRIRDAEMNLAVDAVGRLSFSVEDDHPLYETFQKYAGSIEVVENDASILFRGRIYDDPKNMFNVKTLCCEDAMAYLNDSVVDPYDFPGDYAEDDDYATAAEGGNVVAFWLGKLLANHNAQVSTAQQIQLGTVTVTDPNNYMHRSSDSYDSTWSVISEKLQKSTLGGHLVIRYTSQATYLDYLSEFTLTNPQTIEWSKNLLDLSTVSDDGSFYTAILPLGADGLTIEALPDEPLSGNLIKSGKIIYDSAAVSGYGRITKVVEFKDVTLDTNLLSKAAQSLAQDGLSMPTIIQIKACDLSGIDNVDSFKIARNTVVASAPHNISAIYPLMELDIPILHPQDTVITLGGTAQDLTTAQDHAKTDIIDITGEASDKKISEKMAGILEMVEEYSSSISQTATEIVFNLMAQYVTQDDFSAAVTQLQSQLVAAAENWNLAFTRIEDRIEEVDGEWQEQYEVLKTWFDFSIDGLVIGKSGTPLRLRLINDRISFEDSGLEVAYISNNELYITDARFLNKIRIGNFSLIPRTNSNMSLVKEA